MFADRRFVVVSHREPYGHGWSAVVGETTVSRSAGGLTSALDPLLQALGGLWVAWGSGEADAATVGADDRVCSGRCTAFQPGPASTDRDQVDAVPLRIPGPVRHHLPVKESGCRPLAGSNRSTKGSVLPAAPIGFGCGRRGASLSHEPCRWMSQHGMAAVVTAGGGPEATGRMPKILGRAAAAGAGTGSRFLGTDRMAAAEVDAGAGTSSTRSRSVDVCPRRGLG
jgi:hypothetical protein